MDSPRDVWGIYSSIDLSRLPRVRLSSSRMHFRLRFQCAIERKTIYARLKHPRAGGTVATRVEIY